MIVVSQIAEAKKRAIGDRIIIIINIVGKMLANQVHHYTELYDDDEKKNSNLSLNVYKS